MQLFRYITMNHTTQNARPYIIFVEVITAGKKLHTKQYFMLITKIRFTYPNIHDIEW